MEKNRGNAGEKKNKAFLCTKPLKSLERKQKNASKKQGKSQNEKKKKEVQKARVGGSGCVHQNGTISAVMVEFCIALPQNRDVLRPQDSRFPSDQTWPANRDFPAIETGKTDSHCRNPLRYPRLRLKIDRGWQCVIVVHCCDFKHVFQDYSSKLTLHFRDLSAA